MRLTLRLMGVAFAIILIVIGIDGYLSIEREVDLFKSNMRSNATMLGNVTAQLIEHVWRESRPERALELMQQVGRAEHAIRIRWVWLDDQPGSGRPTVDRDQLEQVLNGEDLTIEWSSNGVPVMCTYVPVHITGDRPAALELSEDFDRLNRYTRESLLRAFALSGLLILLGGGTIWWSGTRLIGQPLDRIMEATRRIGSGDFVQEQPLRGHHELSDLVLALNDMSNRLKVARDTIQSETQRRIEALDQLRHTERLATVGRLASGVAHELGTPLNVIAGQAKILGSDPGNGMEVSMGCRIIAEQSERMTTIIRQLLDFARQRPSKKARTDLTPVLHQVVELLRPMARKAKVEIDLLDHDELPEIVIDQSQMQQVIMNLIVNGIQAMDNGGHLVVRSYLDKTGHSADTADPHAHWACIDIRDEGEGISPDHLSQIFDPFFTTKEVGSGTGLGLSIAHGIVEDHGGHIDVVSRVNVGSCFTVRLPVKEAV